MPAAIFSLGLSMPSVKKGTLFGTGTVPIRIISLGVLTIVTVMPPHLAAFQDLVEKCLDLDQWLIEKAPEVRLHKKRATAKARTQAEADAAGWISYWKDAYQRQFEQATKAQQENFELRSALETLTKLKERA